LYIDYTFKALSDQCGRLVLVDYRSKLTNV